MTVQLVRQRIWVAVLFYILVQVAYLPSAHGFSILGSREFGAPIGWSDSDLEGGLTYAIAANFLTGSGNVSAPIGNAFTTWSDGSTAINFTESGTVSFGTSAGADIDFFSFSSAVFSSVGFGNALAVSLVAISNSVITGVDIFFNTGYFWSDNPEPGEFDIESIALHEVGHAIGLGHPDLADNLGNNYDSSGTSILATGLEVMNSTIAPGEILRVLSSDDLAGRDFLYSSDGSSDSTVTVAASIPPLATPEPSTILLLGSALGALGFFRKRFIL